MADMEEWGAATMMESKPFNIEANVERFKSALAASRLGLRGSNQIDQIDGIKRKHVISCEFAVRVKN